VSPIDGSVRAGLRGETSEIGVDGSGSFRSTPALKGRDAAGIFASGITWLGGGIGSVVGALIGVAWVGGPLVGLGLIGLLPIGPLEGAVIGGRELGIAADGTTGESASGAPQKRQYCAAASHAPRQRAQTRTVSDGASGLLSDTTRPGAITALGLVITSSVTGGVVGVVCTDAGCGRFVAASGLACGFLASIA
jgi:hypothetical protein